MVVERFDQAVRMKILLTTPLNTGEKNRKHPMPPLGLTFIAGMLQSPKTDVSILDNYLEGHNEKAFIDYMNSAAPDIIGITCNAEDRLQAIDLSGIIKKNKKDVVVIAGGPFPTVCHQEIIEDIDTIDIVVRGEGEHTFLQIVSELGKPNPDLSVILGITYRSNGQVKINPPRPFIKDLDELPFPAFDLLEIKKYPNYMANMLCNKSRDAQKINYTASLIFGRGCPFDCLFCSSKEMWNRSYRMSSPQRAVEQIEYYVRQGVNGFAFWDDHLLLKKKWFHSFADLLESKGLEIYFKCLARVESIDEDIARRLHAVGCRTITLGIENGSEAVLRIIKKETDRQQIEKAVSLLSKYEIIPAGGSLVNLPGEKFEDLFDNLEFFCNLKKKYNKSFSFPINVVIYPGTELEKIALKEGKLKGFRWTKQFYEKRNLLINARPYTPVYENVPIEKLIESIMLAAFKIRNLYLFNALFYFMRTKLDIKGVKPGYKRSFYIRTFFKVLINWMSVKATFSRTTK